MCEMCGCPHTYDHLVYAVLTDHAKRKHKRKGKIQSHDCLKKKCKKKRKTEMFVVPSSDDLSHCGISCRMMENTVSVN